MSLYSALTDQVFTATFRVNGTGEPSDTGTATGTPAHCWLGTLALWARQWVGTFAPWVAPEHRRSSAFWCTTHTGETVILQTPG